jgi:hypothetical protein
LRECFQERFLRCFFSVTTIAKESVRYVENSGTVSANDFSKRRFIFRAGLARQFEIGGLFVTVRQKRSSDACVRTASGSDRIVALL